MNRIVIAIYGLMIGLAIGQSIDLTQSMDKVQSRLDKLETTTTTSTTNTTSTTGTTTTTTIQSKSVTRAPRVGGDAFDALARCESSDGRDSANGRYHGYFQFLLSTWHNMGETGDPHTYPYEYQKEVAKRLQARSGWGQWPYCSHVLGLR